MRLVSCDNCGVVLDKDVLNFAREDDIHNEDGSINIWRAGWDSKAGEHLPIVPCPVCYQDVYNRPDEEDL